MTTAVQIFNFDNQVIRVGFNESNEPLWSVADVGEILGIGNPRMSVAGFAEDEKGYISTTSEVGQPIKLLGVTEAGLYRLIFQSRKPEAERFKRWTFHEVLPSIRGNGQYQVQPLSTAEMFVQAGQLLLKHEKQLTTIEQRLDSLDGSDGMLTMQAHVRQERIKNVDVKVLAKRASGLARERGITLGSVPDKKYGKLNTYPRDLFFEVIDELGLTD